MLVGGQVAGRVTVLGLLVAVVASLSWACGSLYQRNAPIADDPLRSSGMQQLAGGIAIWLAALLAGQLGDLHPSEVSRGSALALLYLIVFGWLLTMSCYLWLLRVARTSLVSTYAYVNPVVAVFLGWLILDEPITAQVLGRRGGDPRERRPDRLGGRRGSRRTFRRGSAGEDRARVLLRGLRPPATTSARPAPERSVATPPGAHRHRCRTGR